MKVRILIFFLAIFTITSCNQDQTWVINSGNGQYLDINSTSSVSSDSAMLNTIKPYKSKLDSAMNQVIGQSEKEYSRGLPNGLLNNVFCDMVFEIVSSKYKSASYKPDFCLLNHGGLRRPIPKGDITKSDIFQLMPFENESVICQLSGKQMNKMFNYIYTVNGQPVSNIIISYQDGVFESAIINGKAFDSTKAYNVLTSDYTARGGDNMSFFLEADTMILCGSLIRNDIFEYIESLNGKVLTANEENRIILN